jgi:hypothetical protein
VCASRGSASFGPENTGWLRLDCWSRSPRHRSSGPGLPGRVCCGRPPAYRLQLELRACQGRDARTRTRDSDLESDGTESDGTRSPASVTRSVHDSVTVGQVDPLVTRQRHAPV